MKLDRDTLRQTVNFTAIIAAFIVNVLANTNPLNGLSIGEISNTYFKNVLIIPANYAFAIWGLIYLGLISLAIYQALSANKQQPRLRQMGYLLAASSFAQIVWVILFQYRFFWLSVGAIIIIILPLIALYLRLEIALKATSPAMKWLVNFPISIYFAWISVATIVNVACALYIINWRGWGISPVIWTVIMLVVGTILAATVSLQRKDTAYGGVFIWALVAIAIRHQEQIVIAATAAGSTILLIICLIFSRKIFAKPNDQQKMTDNK